MAVNDNCYNIRIMQTKTWFPVVLGVIVIIIGFYFLPNKNNSNEVSSATPQDQTNAWKTYSDKVVGVEFKYPDTVGYNLVVDEGHGICEGVDYSTTETFTVGVTPVNYAGCYNGNLGIEWLYFFYKNHNYSISFDHTKGQGNALDTFKEIVKTIKLN